MSVTIALLVLWLGAGGLVAAVCAVPGALVGRDDGLPRQLPASVWAIVVLAWPYFLVRWAL